MACEAEPVVQTLVWVSQPENQQQEAEEQAPAPRLAGGVLSLPPVWLISILDGLDGAHHAWGWSGHQLSSVHWFRC